MYTVIVDGREVYHGHNYGTARGFILDARAAGRRVEFWVNESLFASE